MDNTKIINKGCTKFWTPELTDISSKLWLPIESSKFDEIVKNTWFSSGVNYPNKKSSVQIKLRSSLCNPKKSTEVDVIKTKLIRLSPSKEQKKLFKQWTDCSRFVYNQTIDYIRTCIGWSQGWMGIRKDLFKQLPDWCKPIPHKIKAIAVKEAHNAFWKAKGRPKFRTKKASEQSCYIVNTAIKSKGIYPAKSGKGLFFHGDLPNKCKDSRLIWRYEKWWLAVPYKTKLSYGENQAKIVSLDPGIRSFMTFYSTECSGYLGKGDFSRIQRLCFHLDKLISKRDLSKNKQKRRTYTKASRRMRAKIKHLITELHHKTAKFLTDNFDIILLPTFETKQMAKKKKGRINKKSIRMMLTFSHFRFKQFLKWKAHQTGKVVLDCNEAYTSKTHPQTGEIKNIGSTKWIKLLDGSRADRDVVGARNIMLRALVDLPAVFNCVINES